MKNQNPFIYFLSFFFFSLFVLPATNAQIKKIGVLPLHFKVIKKKSDERTRDWKEKNDPTNFEEESIEVYEKKYSRWLEKYINAEFKNKKIRNKNIDLDDLNEEEKKQEAEFRTLIWGEFKNYEMENSRSVSRTEEEKNMKQTGEKTQPIAQLFADKTEQKLLLVTEIIGYHTRKKFEEKNNAPYPDQARGGITIYGLIIEAETGKIVADVQVKIIGGDTKFTEEKIKKIAQKYVRAVGRVKLD